MTKNTPLHRALRSPPWRSSFHWEHLEDAPRLLQCSVSARLVNMRGLISALFLVGIWERASAQFLNNRPFPTYSLENMPDTDFSCRDKILGGYYADADTQCQMFHVCVKVAGVGVQDFRFLCPNGTAFDQDHQICAEWEDVDCDATTLYYSSDNFDLYRIGSGFESKAKKYGEDEETFSLQRAETGDARINKEHQTQRVNQQKENYNQYYQKKARQQEHERDIFKGSSSSNFFNNRNNGKEADEDYDDNVNVNQNRDEIQRRKIVRKQHKRPEQQQRQPQQRPQAQQQQQPQQQQTQHQPEAQHQAQAQQQYQNSRGQFQNRETIRTKPKRPQQQEEQRTTSRPHRPTGFVNNFAGSSFVPTTSRPSSTTINADQYTTAINKYKIRTGQNYHTQNNSPTPVYTISTPAPFKQTQVYNINQFSNAQITEKSKQTENYPSTTQKNNQNFNTQSSTPVTYQTYKATGQYNTNYQQPSSPAPFKQTENYPSNNPHYKKPTTPVKQQNENYPTTFSPKFNQQYNSQNYPTTFAPKTYNQANQHSVNNQRDTTTQYKPNQPQQQNYNYQQRSSAVPTYNAQQTTPKSTPYTQYTPTVPKVPQTTPVSRSNRFDETQYDDGSYDPTKYEYDTDKKEDEFLRTAHSQNIANSRNEYAKAKTPQATSKPYFESPRPFSVSPNTPKATSTSSQVNEQKIRPVPQRPSGHQAQTGQQHQAQSGQQHQAQSGQQHQAQSGPQHQGQSGPQRQALNGQQHQNNQQHQAQNSQQHQVHSSKPKKVKDVSYDYAYYDTHVGSEPEYEIDTEIKKATVKN